MKVARNVVKRWSEIWSRGGRKCGQEVLRSVVGGGWSEVQLRAGQKHSYCCLGNSWQSPIASIIYSFSPVISNANISVTSIPILKYSTQSSSQTLRLGHRLCLHPEISHFRVCIATSSITPPSTRNTCILAASKRSRLW